MRIEEVPKVLAELFHELPGFIIMRHLNGSLLIQGEGVVLLSDQPEKLTKLVKVCEEIWPEGL